MAQLAVDRAYTNLLAHLQRPTSTLPQQTVNSAVSHYLSDLPLPHPTQLTAIVISSSLWHPLSVDVVWSLTTAFRSAVHFKRSNLEKEVRGWFSRRPEAHLVEWIEAIIKGVSRGDAQLRLAILGGLLLGLGDFNNEDSRDGIGERVEEHIIIACAEILEGFSTMEDTWRNEFAVGGTGGIVEVASETLFLSSACQILPLVTSSKLTALDLPTLVEITRKGISAAFLSGGFLSQMLFATTRGSDGRIVISRESTLCNSLQMMRKNPLYDAVGHLAKLLARALSLLAEVTPHRAWSAFNETSLDMKSIVFRVESDWRESLLAGVKSEQDIEPQTREVSTEIWKVLKTLLFTHLLVSQSILSSVIYLRPHDVIFSAVNASSISRSVLHSLHHLSFVLSQFGGVTSSTEGFKELKRVFYMALDIVAADPDPNTSNDLVQELVSGVLDLRMDDGHPFRQSRTAYVLAVVEQLMPVLSDSVIENVVIPFSHPYLNDPMHRETYESAHSVVLSIFAAHATRGERKDVKDRPALAERLVPYYVDSLIQNSSEGRLSTAQLRLAYSSLVRSAASNGDDALAWLCVEALLSRVEASATTRRPVDLYLTLVSLISCVPPSLLLRVFIGVEKALDVVEGEDRAMLSKVLLEEITSRVGDREREVAMKWWCGLLPKLAVAEQEDED